MKTGLWISLALALLLVVGGVFARMADSPPFSLINGRLAPCPGSPNCVCSQDNDPTHHIEPLPFQGSSEVALMRLLTLLRAESRTSVVESRPGYLRVEYHSWLFRFVDDVEFLIDEKASMIEVRSASRVGYSDLGVNRRRIERLRSAFALGPPKL